MSFHSCCKIHRQLLMPIIEKLAEIIAKIIVTINRAVMIHCKQYTEIPFLTIHISYCEVIS